MKTSSKFFLVVLLIIALTACVPTTSSQTTSSQPSLQSSSTTNNTSSTANTGTKLNLNTVTGDQLTATIPSFPNRMIREFQEYRPYVSIQQFRREIGKYVGDTQVAEWEKYVYVPIAINDSDSETLQQIPGLDATEANALIAARPFASADDFINKLSGYVSADELTTAKTYIGG